MLNKWLLAVLALAVSALQAWDSHALDAELVAQAAIGVAVLLPSIAVITTRAARVRLGAAAASAALLVLVRWLSDTHLPELLLAAVFPAVLILADEFGASQRRRAPFWR